MKFYLLSPQCPPNPHLFPMFIDTWKENGIEITDRIEDCDVVLMDLHSRLFDYRQEDLDYIISSEMFFATFDEWDRGGMSKDVWPAPLTPQQLDFVSKFEETGQPRIHFCRLLDKSKLCPRNLYPYEKPILYEEPLLSKEQLWERPYDIVWVANTSPQREMFKGILEKDGRLKCKIILGAKKISLQGWINAHKWGKMFVSWSAGGFGDEKIQHLFSVSAMIKEANNQLFLHDFTHLENCIRPNPNPTKEDIDTIVEIVNNKEKLYEIYKNGYEFVKKYYSKEYISNDILSKIKKHLS